MESRIEIVDRINGLRKQLAFLEEQSVNPDLTLQQLEQIDTEWEFVNDEIGGLEELLWFHIPEGFPVQELEEPIEDEDEQRDDYYVERELEGEGSQGLPEGEYYIPSLHEQQNDYTYEPVFDLADEI